MLKEHLLQLKRTIDQLIEAGENKSPADDWNYTSEQLSDLKDLYKFRLMQVEERCKFVITKISEELK